MDYQFLVGERFRTRGGAIFKVCAMGDAEPEPCVRAVLVDDPTARLRSFTVQSVLQRLIPDEVIDVAQPAFTGGVGETAA